MNAEKYSCLTNKLSEIEKEIKEFIIETLRQHGKVSLNLPPDSDEETDDNCYPVTSTLYGKHDNPQIKITDIYLDEHDNIYADGRDDNLGTKETGFYIYSEQYSDILYFLGHVIN